MRPVLVEIGCPFLATPLTFAVVLHREFRIVLRKMPRGDILGRPAMHKGGDFCETPSPYALIPSGRCNFLCFFQGDLSVQPQDVLLNNLVDTFFHCQILISL